MRYQIGVFCLLCLLLTPLMGCPQEVGQAGTHLTLVSDGAGHLMVTSQTGTVSPVLQDLAADGLVIGSESAYASCQPRDGEAMASLPRTRSIPAGPWHSSEFPVTFTTDCSFEKCSWDGGWVMTLPAINSFTVSP